MLAVVLLLAVAPVQAFRTLNTVTPVNNKAQWDFVLADSAAKNRTVIAEFGAVWCGPCTALRSWVQQMSDKYNDLHFVAVDVDDVKEVAKQYNIITMPTFIVLQDTREKERASGAIKSRLEALFHKYSKY